MIHVVESSNLQVNGDLYIGQFRLRHQEFIERQAYDVKVYNDMEFDEYDTPATIYLVCTDSKRKVLGVSRLIPTVIRCMLVDHWPHALFFPKEIVSSNVWEGTRFCVDKNLSPHVRRKVAQELCASYLEYGLSNGIDKIVGLMNTLVLRTVFERNGIQYSAIGEVTEVSGYARVQAAEMSVNLAQLISLRKVTGLGVVIQQEYNVYSREGSKNAA